MSDPKPSARGADWTRLLADPDLVSHLSELLRTYRDAPPAERERTLLAAMRRIKEGQGNLDVKHTAPKPEPPPPEPVATDPSGTPPFEPSIFQRSWGDDRRVHPRMRCFVVVELRNGDSEKPCWGNLSNISLGGCFVETPIGFEAGSKVAIGLWVASGQIWVKGLVLNGVVSRNSASHGLRLRFADLEPAGRETLRQFLKYVESCTKNYESDHGYLAQLKR